MVVQDRCSRQLVQIVARRRKSPSSRRKADLSTVGTATRSIEDSRYHRKTCCSHGCGTSNHTSPTNPAFLPGNFCLILFQPCTSVSNNRDFRSRARTWSLVTTVKVGGEL